MTKEKLPETLLYKKFACKMLMKLTQESKEMSRKKGPKKWELTHDTFFEFF
jgi:hypothetical protein